MRICRVGKAFYARSRRLFCGKAPRAAEQHFDVPSFSAFLPSYVCYPRGLSRCDITDDDVDGGALGLCLDNAGRTVIETLDLSTNLLATVPEGLLNNLTFLSEL